MSNEMLELADKIEWFGRLDAQAGVGALCASNAAAIIIALRASAVAEPVAPAAAPTREEIISIVEDECFLNDFSPVEKTKSRKTLWRVGNIIRDRILALKAAPAK